MKKLKAIIILLFISQVMNLHAQNQKLSTRTPDISPGEIGIPFIHNYIADDYNAHAQNWAILQDKRGVMIFGNGNGVLEFDGIYWKLTPLSNNSIVRSLAMDEKGVIYVGGVNEFGYLAYDNKGKSVYVSLSERLSEDEKAFSNVWGTQATTHGIYFLTNKKTFRYHDGKIDVIPFQRYRNMYAIKDGLILRNRDEGGLYVLKEGKLQLLPHSKKLTGKKHIGM